MPQEKTAFNTFRAHQDRNKGTVVRQVGEKVWLCDTHDTLFLQRMGGLDSARSRFGFSSIGANSYEWINENNLPNFVTLTADLALPVSNGADAFGHPTYPVGTITVDNPQYLFRGMVLWLQPPPGTPMASGVEYVWVSAVNMTTRQVTVVRGWRGTPVYAYDATPGPIKACILTIVAEECHEFVLNANVARSTAVNYWQTFVSGLSKSKKYQYIEHYGVEDDYQRQMTRIMGGTIEGRRVSGELPRMLEQAVLYGLPSPGGPAGDSSFGGINSFPINQVVVPVLTLDTIQDALQKALMDGGDIGRMTLVTSPAIQRMMSGWSDGIINRDRTDTSIGRRINSINSDWGTIEVEWHRHLRANEMYIVDFTEMGLLQLWEFTETRLGLSTSLCEDTMIDGAYGFALACPCHHTRIRIDASCFDPGCTGPGCAGTEPAYVADPTPGQPV